MQVSLKELGGGAFLLRWWMYDPAGKRCYRQRKLAGVTKRHAQQERTKLQRELDIGEHVDPSPLTIAEYMERWISDSVRGTRRNQTARGYVSKARRQIVPHLGKIRLDSLTGIRIDRFYRDLKENGRLDGKGGLSDQTILHVHRVLHTALEQAVRWKLIPRNPCNDATPPKPQERDVQFLSEAELDRLLLYVQGKEIYLPTLIASRTGMRRGEVLGLQWDCVRLEEGKLTVKRSLEHTREYGIQIKEVKTKDGKRTITIEEDAAAHPRLTSDLGGGPDPGV